MDIEIRDNKKEEYILQVGDIVKIGDYGESSLTVVMKDDKRYILRNMFNIYCITGYYDSLEELTRSLDTSIYIIYPQSEYKLVLERK